MSEPTDALAPLNAIRTETVFSRLPTHNLSRRKRVKIHLVRHNDRGQVELYWNVSANEEYGLPGELAYKIDTIIINRRIDELGRPLPRIIRLGSICEICRELGIPTDGRDIRSVKKAILQNAGAFITAKLTYKGTDGTERQLEAGFTRYSLVFTGEQLPGGKQADAVYIILNEPYWEVLNNAPVRPLDYDYLRKLPPTVQRFYEILSYRMFFAIKHNQPEANLLYSDYCAFSAQNRYYDYDHFKKQMYKVHRPHRASGYIAKVRYDEIRDPEDRADWLMSYTPGPKAKAEYKAFNGKQPIEGKLIGRKKSVASRSTKPNTANEPPNSPTKEASGTSGSDAALELVRYFHKLARGVENYQPYRGIKEKSQALALVNAHGLERARFVIDFAVAQARKTNFQMQTFGAVLQYVSDAINEHERQENMKAQKRAQAEEQLRQEEANIDARLKALPKKSYRVLYSEVKGRLLTENPWLEEHQASAMFRSLVKKEMLWELDRRAREK